MTDRIVALPELDAEVQRLRQLERVVLNQLGTTDPRAVALFIVEARGLCVPCPLPPHVARCAPQAGGASEQDVIGLLREHTARVEHPLRTVVPESRGSC